MDEASPPSSSSESGSTSAALGGVGCNCVASGCSPCARTLATWRAASRSASERTGTAARGDVPQAAIASATASMLGASCHSKLHARASSAPPTAAQTAAVAHSSASAAAAVRRVGAGAPSRSVPSSRTVARSARHAAGSDSTPGGSGARGEGVEAATGTASYRWRTASAAPRRARLSACSLVARTCVNTARPPCGCATSQSSRRQARACAAGSLLRTTASSSGDSSGS